MIKTTLVHVHASTHTHTHTHMQCIVMVMRDTSCSDGQINWLPPRGSHGSATSRVALKKAQAAQLWRVQLATRFSSSASGSTPASQLWPCSSWATTLRQWWNLIFICSHYSDCSFCYKTVHGTGLDFMWLLLSTEGFSLSNLLPRYLLHTFVVVVV